MRPLRASIVTIACRPPKGAAPIPCGSPSVIDPKNPFHVIPSCSGIAVALGERGHGWTGREEPRRRGEGAGVVEVEGEQATVGGPREVARSLIDLRRAGLERPNGLDVPRRRHGCDVDALGRHEVRRLPRRLLRFRRDVREVPTVGADLRIGTRPDVAHGPPVDGHAQDLIAFGGRGGVGGRGRLEVHRAVRGDRHTGDTGGKDRDVGGEGAFRSTCPRGDHHQPGLRGPPHDLVRPRDRRARPEVPPSSRECAGSDALRVAYATTRSRRWPRRRPSRATPTRRAAGAGAVSPPGRAPGPRHPTRPATPTGPAGPAGPPGAQPPWTCCPAAGSSPGVSPPWRHRTTMARTIGDVNHTGSRSTVGTASPLVGP